MDIKDFDKELVELAFYAGVYSGIHLDILKKAIVIKMPKFVEGRFLNRSELKKYATLEEYAYYLNLRNKNASMKEWADMAYKLGTITGAFYTSLVQQSVNNGKKVVTDLFENNLKFYAVKSSNPTIADPAFQIDGWVSFRFLFAASLDSRP